MPIHYQFDLIEDLEEKQRTARKLLLLRDYLDTHLPARTVTGTLLLATWNIREFDSNSFGKRTWESIHYIAEIISRFDIVAVQEVREDLTALYRVKQVLGPTWDWFFSDVTEGSRGNNERMAYLYDARKVRFSGLAGEIVLPTGGSKDKPKPPLQLARTPHLVGFETGWFRFALCTVHIYWGEEKANESTRVREIRELAQLLQRRAESRDSDTRHLILLGDFNIFKPNTQTFAELVKAGFAVPEKLQSLPSNVASTKRHYDQIALYGGHLTRLTRPDACGVLNYFERLYLDDEEQTYTEAMDRYKKRYHTDSDGNERDAKQRADYYRKWRTYQLSDHLPMWVELKIDFSEEKIRAQLGEQ
jgi:endonuclease/exonuclease/phosphatase family metal-dependent hydrolase